MTYRKIGYILMTAFLGSAISSGVSYKASKKDRAWRERMTRNAYQYTMADMRKAGLNPMLAFSQGPMSTPGAGAMPKIDIDTKDLASTAMQVKKFGSELRNVEQQTATNEALAAKHTADAAITNAGVPVALLKAEAAGEAITASKNLLEKIQTHKPPRNPTTGKQMIEPSWFDKFFSAEGSKWWETPKGK